MKPLTFSVVPNPTALQRQSALAFCSAALLCGSGLPSGSGALSLGLLAAAGGEWAGIAAFFGTIVGCICLLDFPHALRTFATALLLLSAFRTFPTLLRSRPAFVPCLTAILTALVEGVYAWQDPLPQAAPALLTVLFATGTCLLLRPLFSDGEVPSLLLAIDTLYIGIVLTLARWQFASGLTPAHILGLFFILLIAYCQGSGKAGCFGFTLGACLDLSCGSSAYLCTLLYGLGGLCGGFRSRSSRIPTALAFLFPACVLLLTQQVEEALLLLYETLWATLLFLLIPTPMLRRLLRRTAPVARPAEQGLREQLRQQLADSAAAFRELRQHFGRGQVNREEDPSVVFDRVAERLCQGCTLCHHCWEKEYESTKTACNDSTLSLLRRGQACATDFPPYFSNRCLHFPQFLEILNQELASYEIRKRCQMQVAEAQQNAIAQWEQLSALLDSTADSLGAVPTSTDLLHRCQIGAALRPKQGLGISGDSLTVFQTAEGQLCLLLCDGMGSGEEAHRESALALRLLERFLQSGIDPLVALKTLNQALSLPSDGHSGFTTIDLLCFNLQNGQGTLYKYGAAPTYLLQNRRVTRVTCSCLPAGVLSQPTPPEQTSLQLQDGSLLVMVTDGLSSGGMEDLWLQDLLARWEGGDPQSLATWILAESRKHGGLEDDCGILVLSLPVNQTMAKAI